MPIYSGIRPRRLWRPAQRPECPDSSQSCPAGHAEVPLNFEPIVPLGNVSVCSFCKKVDAS